MRQILDLLVGGDRRSIGKSDEVVQIVLRQPANFDALFQGFYSPHPVVRMRTADAVEKITAEKPELLLPYHTPMLEMLEHCEQMEVQWHLAQIIPRLSLSPTEVFECYHKVEKYLASPSAIVNTFALQCLVDLAFQQNTLLTETKRHLKAGGTSRSKAVQSRCRKLIKEMEAYEKH